MKAVILIVDDERHTREGLRASLEDNFDVYTAADLAGAVGVLERETVDAMVTDLRLGGDDGLKLIEKALQMPHPPICIMMTAYGSVDAAVEAMKQGAYDFVTKPLNLDKLEILLKRALRSREVETENVVLRQHLDTKFGLESFVGNSLAMAEVYETIKQVAPSRATVLIEGESGTGKELAARAIHNLSRRDKSKFLAVHCAALSPPLLESELFGHERGAFTGANERRIGRFERANGGTLFLDEIGEIDLGTQTKLLRVLGERSFERVGGSETIKIDVRLVAATNKHLEKLVSEGKFRDDLFYRLNVVRLTMPPLRDRADDIPLLVQAFLREFSEENGQPLKELAPEAMNSLLAYDWPGNVRELRTAIERSVVMSRGARITGRDLPPAIREVTRPIRATSGGWSAPAGQFNLQDTEHRLIMRALEETNGNITAAAHKLGLSRRTLHRRLKELKDLTDLKDSTSPETNPAPHG